jgi:hypothetical protein
MAAQRYQTERRGHIDDSLCNFLDRLYLGRRGVRAGSMFGSRAYFVGRRLMACATTRGVCLRLGPRRATQAIAAGAAIPFRPHGRVMRGWVEIESARVPELHDSANLFVAALAFTRSLAQERDR